MIFGAVSQLSEPLIIVCRANTIASDLSNETCEIVDAIHLPHFSFGKYFPWLGNVCVCVCVTHTNCVH